MNYKIDAVSKVEYPDIVNVWEASVRATHHFLKEEDIEFYRPLILNEYLNAVDLRCARGAGNKIVGFLGVVEGNIEMLFIHPETRGKGVGKLLLKFAIEDLNAQKVDVNEDNQQAVGFYERMGFHTINRSQLDNQGKPYPILHMELL